jgi:hypothetical protein
MCALRAFIWGLLERFIDPLLAWASATSGRLVVPVAPTAMLAAVAAVFEAQVQAAVG